MPVSCIPIAKRFVSSNRATSSKAAKRSPQTTRPGSSLQPGVGPNKALNQARRFVHARGLDCWVNAVHLDRPLGQQTLYLIRQAVEIAFIAEPVEQELVQ